MSDLDRRLAPVAARQRLLLTLDDVRAADGTVHNARRRVVGGRWVRVERGVYLVAGAELDWATRQAALVLAAGEGAAASHLAAARVWGLPGFSRTGHELSIPRGRRFRRDGVRTHESTDLDRCRIVVADGVPVTDPDRTMLDLGRYLGPRRLARAIEDARRDGLVDWSSLIRTLARHARQGRHGVRRLREVILAEAGREQITDTDVELLVLSLLREAGLPEPVVHHHVYDGQRFVAELDLAYPPEKVAIECDGDVHLLEEVHERDLPRQNDLVLLGWTVLRFTSEAVRQRPFGVVGEVREALAAVRAAS